MRILMKHTLSALKVVMRILMKHTLSALKVVKDAYIDETYFIGP